MNLEIPTCGHCALKQAVTLVMRRWPVCEACKEKVRRIARIYGAVFIGGRTIKKDYLVFRELA